jgi:hypothetical protein
VATGLDPQKRWVCALFLLGVLARGLSQLLCGSGHVQQIVHDLEHETDRLPEAGYGLELSLVGLPAKGPGPAGGPQQCPGFVAMGGQQPIQLRTALVGVGEGVVDLAGDHPVAALNQLPADRSGQLGRQAIQHELQSQAEHGIPGQYGHRFAGVAM